MTLFEEQFLWLLRAGLWGKEESKFPMIAPCYIDWSSLLSLAKRQTNLLLVQDGLEVLLAMQTARQEERVVIPPRGLLKIQNMRMQTQQIHRDLNAIILEIDTMLRKVGISPILLKGESMSAIYPRPESRNCGDIDLYVDPDDYARAAALLSTRFETLTKTTEKHGSFRRGRYNIELHFRTLVPQRPWCRRAYDDYSRSVLSQAKERLPLPFAEGKVLVPPVTYNAIFLLGHIYHHFIEGGIGLRQICDWTLFVDRHGAEWDREELSSLLERFGMMDAWRVFGCMSVKYLGLSPDKMPFYDEREQERAERVLSIVLREGNFGRYGRGALAEKKEDSFSRKKSKSLRLFFQRAKLRFSIFPKDVLLYFPKWLGESLSRLSL